MTVRAQAGCGGGLPHGRPPPLTRLLYGIETDEERAAARPDRTSSWVWSIVSSELCANLGLAAGPRLGSSVPALQVVASTMSTPLEEEDGEPGPGGWTHDDTLELLGLSPAKLQSPPLASRHGGSDLEPTVMEETSLASLAAARSGSSSAAGSSDEGDQAVKDESMVMML